MRIGILTVGSRGDVQPFVALGRGLKAAGHEVIIVTAEMFASMVSDHGLLFRRLSDDLLRLKDTPEGRGVLEGRGGKLALLRQVNPLLRTMLDEAWAASRDLEAIIYHPKALAGYHIAEKLRIPGILSLPVPLYTPTQAFPLPILPPRIRLGGWFNQGSYSLLKLIAVPFRDIVRRWRTETLELPPRRVRELTRADGAPVPVLYGYSEHIVPRPPDWPEWVAATGYWLLDRPADWRPPTDLARFIETGPRPVYLGFGSMTGNRDEKRGQLVLEALARLRLRGVIATGWGGLKMLDLPETVFALERAPHDWLFPRVSVVVHHGGAGTTAAALRSGRSSVICPFMGDQPFWGDRLYRLGVGPKPIPQKRLTVENLTQAIRTAIDDTDIRARTLDLSRKIRAEDGIARAVKFIERHTASSAIFRATCRST